MSIVLRPFEATLLFCTLISLGPAVALGGSDDSGITIDEIVRAWDARTQKVRTVRFKWTEPYLLAPRWHPHSILPWRPEQGPKNGAGPVAVPHAYVPELSLVIDGDNIRFETTDLTLSLKQQLVPQASVWVWTAKEYWHLYKPGAVAHPRANLSESIHTTSHPGDDPYVLPLLMIYRPFHPAVGVFENFAARFRIVAGKHLVHGRQCILLQDEPRPMSGIRYSLYVDPQRDFLPIRLDYAAKLGRTHRIDFLEYEQRDEGWVLVRWAKTIAVGSIDGPVISECSLNAPVGTGEFALEFPAGTWVSELESPTTYIAREAGGRRAITPKELTSGAVYERFLATETGTLAAGPDTTNDPAARLAKLAAHRARQVQHLKSRTLWSIPIVSDADVEVRVKAIGNVHPQSPAEISIDDASCDQMLFGKGRNEAAARSELAARLRRKVDAVDQKCGLTDEQKEKLEFAGREEIAMFFKQGKELRLRIKAPYDETAVKKGWLDTAILKLVEETRPLRLAVDSEAFEDGSRFANALKAVLTPAQAAANRAIPAKP